MNRFAIGTTMKKEDLERELGTQALEYNRDMTKLLREIAAHSGHVTDKEAKKLDFYMLIETYRRKVEEPQVNIMQGLRGIAWNTTMTVGHNELMEAQQKINKEFSYGDMSKEDRHRYIQRFCEELNGEIKYFA